MTRKQERIIDSIVAILKKHEEYLSDGFSYYYPSWHSEYGDIESSDQFLRIVATEIGEAIAATVSEMIASESGK